MTKIALLQALQNFASPEIWLFIFIGVFIGIIFGIVPGLSGIVAVSLVLPFVFILTPEQALPLIISIWAVQFMGGSVTAILLGIPGTPPSAATLLDGYPMSQKGEAGRALGAAMTSSGAGSVVTGLVALAGVFVVYPMVMALRTADMVFIVLLGVAFIGILGSDSMIKGLVSGGLGLLISFIGFQPSSGLARFTFGSLYLYDGLPLLPVILGIFALPEMISLASSGGSIAKTAAVVRGMKEVWVGVSDVGKHWGLCVRSAIIGFVAGLIPGPGASAATFVAYGQAKKTSKHPETFGFGNVEGVIAPESANDAKEGGAVLTTLAIGIPGSGDMVLLLGAMTLLGIAPGPVMLTQYLPLTITLMWTILMASFIGVVICLPLCPYLAKVAFIPSRILVPVVITMVAVGLFTYKEVITDLLVALIFGAIGLVMKKFEFNRPALVLGFVLGTVFERNFFLALSMNGPFFFMRPVSIGIILIIIALFAYDPIKGVFERSARRRKQ